MRAFAGVLLAAIALGGALALRNEVRASSSVTYPKKEVWCGTNDATRSECQFSGDVHSGANGWPYITEGGNTVTSSWNPGWVDPVALALAIAGVGCGLVLVARQRRLL